MKRLLLIQVFLLFGICALSQKECKDVIYAIEGNKMIFNCCIQDIRQGNVVIYKKDGAIEGIEAYAVMIDDQYIELDQPGKINNKEDLNKTDYRGNYQGHSYYYYDNLYHSARLRAGFGKVITISGIVLAGYGLIFTNPQYDGSASILLGSLMISVGVPLWISGGVKADNNRHAMDKIKKSTHLSMSLGQYGIGLVYRF
jgi:hypothetical protein